MDNQFALRKVEFWQNILRVVETVSVEMVSHEADEEVVHMGMEALYQDIKATCEVNQEDKVWTSLKFRLGDGRMVVLKIEAHTMVEV